MPSPSSAAPAPAARRELFAFCMYDWANSAYSTISITVLVSYVKAVLDATHPGLGATVWGWGIGVTVFFAAIASPISGAIADAHASKNRWLAVTTVIGAVAAMLLFFATPDRPWLLVAIFLVAHFFYELSFCFYNAFLPDLATDENMGRVSAGGYVLGYIGGGLALVVVLFLFLHGHRMGLPLSTDARVTAAATTTAEITASMVQAATGAPAATLAVSSTALHLSTFKEDPTALLPRLGLLIMGLWWGLFSLPAILWLKDRGSAGTRRLPLREATRKAGKEVLHTLRNIRRYRILFIFLISFLLFNDGVQTIISQASVFADEVLSMKTSELALLILMIQFVAVPGAWIMGWLADKIGEKRVLIGCLITWILIMIYAFYVTTKTQFWYMAVVVALIMGGTQSVSRALMGQMTPKARAGEFFGFFNLSGKATSFAGPPLFSTVLVTTKSAHWAIVSLLVFFIGGLALLCFVDVQQGRQEARAAEAEPQSPGGTP